MKTICHARGRDADTENVRYEAFARKDNRFDGRFFVGVVSTGIYCRPVCRAKLPKRENCTFYATAAEAERAGFRPCLLCRPELAPGSADVPVDATALLVLKASRLIEASCAHGESMREIARRLACSDRHLRRAFVDHLRVSPVQYLQTCRLLLAKGLLTNSTLPIIDVAMAAGFNSLRRFNALFKDRYRLAPTVFRKAGSGAKAVDGNITVALGYRPPYQWGQMLDFLKTRAIPGVEAVENGAYRRLARFVKSDGQSVCGRVTVAHEIKNHTLTVAVDDALLGVLPQVLARVRQMFDLYCDPTAVYEGLKSMNEIKRGLCVLGTRLPGCFDAFEMAVRAVLGQQITVKAARTLAARLAQAYGTPMKGDMGGLTHAFPSAQDIAALRGPIGDRLGPLGITGTRAQTIFALARAFSSGEMDFALCAEPQDVIEKLMGITGIGSWTAHYIAMRAFGWYDAFPETDYGVKKALAPRGQKEIAALAQRWRPWRGYATINLWNAL